MIRSKFVLSVLIDAGTMQELIEYKTIFSTLVADAQSIEIVIGLKDAASAGTGTELSALLNGLECQQIHYTKSDSMTAHSELVFAARGECLLFISKGNAVSTASLAAALDLTTRSQDKIPLKERFFWGSAGAMPASYLLFGVPAGTTPNHAGGIQLLLVNRRNWLRAVASDNSLLVKLWNDQAWHTALSSSSAWGDLSLFSTGAPAAPEISSPQPALKNHSKSELDEIIPPEIKHDEFYHTITDLASTLEISTILEIGSSSGGGSTEAFVNGLARNPSNPTLYCLEVSLPRFQALEQRYEHLPCVRCLNASSVPVTAFPSKSEVELFYTSHQTILNQYPLDQVLGWLEQDLRYINEWEVPGEGIEAIKSREHITQFDLVLIDGSEFSGEAELERVYGARYILLDDVASFKNFKNRERLLQDSDYELLRENLTLRNGYSVFKRKSNNDRRTRAQRCLESVFKSNKPGKVVLAGSLNSAIIKALPDCPTDLDLCVLESDRERAETASTLCKQRTHRSAVLLDESSNLHCNRSAVDRSIIVVSSPAAVALGRFHYRPDLIILNGETKSILEEWENIRNLLVGGCLIAVINPHQQEIAELSRKLSLQRNGLQAVSCSPDDGFILFRFDPRTLNSVHSHGDSSVASHV